MNQPAVYVDGLGYTFAGRTEPSLSETSFRLEPGTWTLIAGRTGSGKSTLLRALAGLIPHHTAGAMSGSVQIFGRDLGDIPPAKLAGDVGLVLQSPDDQICSTTAAAEVAFGLENLCLPACEIASRVEDCLAQVGLAGFEQRRTAQLSGGQKQRLMLAAALAMRPRLLLLDEPLSQLDSQGAAELLAELDRLRATGLTIVIVEHRLDDVLPRADRVLLLDAGRLVADAPAIGCSGIRENSAGQSSEFSRLPLPEAFTDSPLEQAFSKVGLEFPEVMRLSLRLGLGGLSQPQQVIAAISNPRRKRGNLPLPSLTIPVSVDETLVQVSGLSFRFSPQLPPVWQDVGFSLNAGDRVALVGANGSGKSTLLAVLAGLLAPSSGSIFVAGSSAFRRPVRSSAFRRFVVGSTALRRVLPPKGGTTSGGTTSGVDGQFGLVLQNPDLMLFCRTVFDELAFGPRRQWPKLDAAAIEARVQSAADLLSLQDLLNDPPLALSQGQRLRAAIAATLSTAPKMLLLDEPTTGQDQRQVAAILESLSRQLKQAMGIEAVLFSTHDLRFVSRFANRVLVLGNGRLLADCTPDELFADEALLAAAHLRRPPLAEIRIALGLHGRTVEELLEELVEELQ